MPSSGNVFADLGLPESDELLAKADLAHANQQLIQGKGLSQRAAARVLGVAQPDLSNLSDVGSTASLSNGCVAC